jgi:hypothetical protein
MNLLTIRTNMLWLKLTLTILAFGACKNAHAQLWQKFTTFGGIAEDQSHAMIQLRDQGYLIVGSSEDPVALGGDGDKDVAVIKTDVDGRRIWSTNIDPSVSKTERGLDVVTDGDGNIYIAGELDYFTNPNFDIYLVKLNSKGNLIWDKIIGESNTNERATSIEITSDGHIIIAGSKESDLSSGNGNGGLDAYISKLSLDGDIVWEQTYGYNFDDVAYDILEQDDYYAFTGKSKHPQTESFDIFLAEINKNDGALQGAFNLISTENAEEEAKSFLWDASDNTYVIAGKQSVSQMNSNMLWTKVKVDEANPGSLLPIWTDPYALYNGDANLGDGAEKIIQTVDGTFVIAGFEEITVSKIGFTVFELDNAGTQTWIKKFSDPNEIPIQAKNYFVSDLVERPNQEGFALTGTRSNTGASINDIFHFRTGPQATTYSNTIQGLVYNDLNGDCGYDSGETLLKNWIVRAVSENDEYEYTSTTDAEGNYIMVVPEGSYELSISEKNSNWDIEVCSSSSIINFSGPNQNEEIDFGVGPNVNCAFPYLEINTSTLGVDCNEGEITYEVLITNYGAFTSNGTSVEVLLDDKYNYVTSSITGIVNGNQVLFDIEDLETNQSELFTLTVSTDCSGALDLEAYEIKANIVDAELCDPDGSYDYENYSVEATCIGEGQIEVTIKNDGPEIAAIAEYIIIEDIVINREIIDDENGPVTINPGENFKDTISLQLPISTGRIIVPQEEDYPGRSIPTDFLEGCTDNDNFNTGFVLNFLEDDAEGFTAIDVQENKALLSGNFMEVTPRGLPPTNAVATESGLKYRIYFENESIDTVYSMTIRDTLPEQTVVIQEGNSSHPYSFDVYENTVARFTFDSIAFAPGDKGYVEYKLFVEQQGTEDCEPIENNALIIFENQEPILTGTVYNEICGNDYAQFVEIVDTPLAPTVPDLKMNIYPNPFQTECTIELLGMDIYFWSMELYTLSGQLVQTHNSNSETLTLNRAGLDSGIYVVKILADNQVVKTAKLVVH